MKLAELQELEARWLMQTYPRAPVEFVRGEGARLWDSVGKEYLDFLAGIGVNNVGHSHPEVVAAVQEQAGKYLHAMVYGEYVQEPQVRLARLLSLVTPDPLEVVYFTNSGTEANEGALKLAKKYTGRRRLVAFASSYHGDTHGSLSVTGRDVYRTPFLPLLPECHGAPPLRGCRSGCHGSP